MPRVRAALLPMASSLFLDLGHWLLPPARDTVTQLALEVARLAVHIDAAGSGIRIQLPECHSRFRLDAPPSDGLSLSVRAVPLCPTAGWRPLYCPSETWQLWLDEAGRYAFVASPHAPPARQLFVEKGFGSGEVLIGDAGILREEALYPLADLDIKLYANWLAESGDLILHAAGVAMGGRGFCFAGASGAGKSTLAAAFAGAPGVSVLGEDNLVVRYIDGRFWMWGTPWHLNPERCSALGVPLEKVFILDRPSTEGVRRCTPAEGVSRLVQSAFLPYYRADAVGRILEKLALLADRVPPHALGYRLGSDPLDLLQ